MRHDFSHTRLWWPGALVDEMMPDGRAAPEAWLAPDDAGVTAIYWEEDGNAPTAPAPIPLAVYAQIGRLALDRMVLELDPPGAVLDNVRVVALALRNRLFVQHGLHVERPVDLLGFHREVVVQTQQVPARHTDSPTKPGEIGGLRPLCQTRVAAC